MKALVIPVGAIGGLLAFATTTATAGEFRALPGLWKTTYEIRGGATKPNEPKVLWHCVDEEADPWVSFAQLQDLPGMTCTRPSLERTSLSLKWRSECRGPGPATRADLVVTEGAIVFDSPQHYTGWVKFSGTVMGYPIQSVADVEGARQAACTSPSD
jgi:hypothetical protein